MGRGTSVDIKYKTSHATRKHTYDSWTRHAFRIYRRRDLLFPFEAILSFLVEVEAFDEPENDVEVRLLIHLQQRCHLSIFFLKSDVLDETFHWND